MSLVMRNGRVQNESLVLSGDSQAELREVKRENRELKKYLLSVSTVVAQSVAVLDAEMKQPSTVERGKRIAAVANMLEHANDSMMHFGLKLDFDKIKRLKKRWEIFKTERHSTIG
jgi:hypothetical protein